MYEKQEDLDWSEPSLTRWLSSITRESTKRSYKAAFRRYAAFTKQTASQLIDEAIEDSKLDEREKKDIVRTRLLAFYDALQKNGLSSFYCNTSVQSIRSFYQTFNIAVSLKGRSKIPKVKAKNKRLMITPEILRKLIDNTKSLRDRAILLILFQSGMDIATLCSLRFCDVNQGLSEDQSPMKIIVQRPKTGTDYYIFIGRDSIEALKNYVNDLKARDFQLNDKSPLFFVEGSQSKKSKPLTPNLLQNSFRDIAIRTGFLKDIKDRNSLSPHSFRESFSSILLNNNVPDSIVDFLLRHEIGTMGEAYKKTNFEDGKRMYAQIEPKISLNGSSNNHGKIEAIEETIIQIQKENVIHQTALEVITNRTVELEKDNKRLREELQQKTNKEESIKIFDEIMKDYLSDPEKRKIFSSYFAEASINADLHQEYEDEVKDFIFTHLNVKPDKVKYSASMFGNEMTINISGYWIKGKYFQIHQRAKILIP
ncbi:MAG: hypothetical protein QG670_1452 [Thermoproteota archaeon]|nr:hypothetical protein [Thermoproteota archaeon]